MRVIAEKILHLRKKNLLRQSDLADKLGVAPVSVSQWENGHNVPNAKASLLLAELFGVTIQSLLYDEQDLVYISEQSGGMDTIPDLAAMQNQITAMQKTIDTQAEIILLLKEKIALLEVELLREIQGKA